MTTQISPHATANKRRNGALPALATAAAICAFALLPALIDRHFYYRDDWITEYMPMFLEIARLLKAGDLPFITDRTWYGGAILAEAQFAVLNPFNLVAYLVLDRFESLAAAATFYSVAHLGLYAAGIVLLCVRLGFARVGAAAAAVIACSSAWLLHWAAASWVPALSSMAWLPWGALGLLKAYRSRRWTIVAAGATALPFLSGYPFTILCWAGVLLIVVVETLGRAQDRAGAIRVAAAVAGGGLMATPAIFPLAIYLGQSLRTISSTAAAEWRSAIDGLLSVGMPSFASVWPTADGPLFVPTPSFYYACWFAPFVLALFHWRQRDWRLNSFAALTLVFGVLAILPGFWTFRFSMRYLPFFHLGLGLCVGWILTIAGNTWTSDHRWPIGRVMLVTAIPLALAILNAPSLALTHVAFTAIVLTLLLVTWLMVRWQRPGWYVLFAGQALIFVMTMAAGPPNLVFPDWKPPDARPAHRDDGPTMLSLFGPLSDLSHVGTGRDPGLPFWQNIAVGNTRLLHGNTTINGYTPVRLKGLVGLLCFNWISATCPAAAQQLFERDERTGLLLIDLLRVDLVTADKVRSTAFRARAGAAWKEVALANDLSSFTRVEPLARPPGSIAWLGGDPQVALLSRSSAKEIYDVSVPAGAAKGAEIVFARAWYPGFAAEIDGKALAVEAYRSVFPTVRIPAGTSGRLTLSYRPAGFDLGLWVALLALMGLAIVQFAPPSRLRWSSAAGISRDQAATLSRQ